MDTIKKDKKRNFSNTISAGLKSITGKGKSFYVVEFKTNTQLHRATTSKQVIVDYIEIGRSPKCQIRFGEDCRLVSGVHCAIIKEGEDHYIKHLSKTNPTLINGKPVADKWYLNSGDEVQLSYGGPIFGFIVPPNNLTNTIPLTRRLGLFKEQALKPYKRAITGLAVALLLCVVTLGFYAYRTNEHTNLAMENIIKIIDENDSLQKGYIKIKTQNDSLFNAILKKVKMLDSLRKVVKGDLGGIANLSTLYPGVYFIMAMKIEKDIDGDKKERPVNWTGTGFMLSDGRFITARHIIEPWFYIKKDDEDEPYFFENVVASDGGIVKAYFKAISASGDILSFTSADFNFDKSGDKYYQHKTNIGTLNLTEANFKDDWASFTTKGRGIFENGASIASSLNVGVKLGNLGFPFGIGAGGVPVYSEFMVSRSGIPDGVISISGRSFDEGSSGGPVFFKTSSGYKVVGIVSAEIGTHGFIIPISKVR